MRVGFDGFSEILERNCFNAWRSVFGRDDRELIEAVNSVLFTRSESGGMWTFSFAVRRGDRWFQAKEEIPEVTYDPMDPPPFDDASPEGVRSQMSPENLASELSVRLLGEVARKVRDGRGR